MIAVEHLTKAYGHTQVLQDLNFTIQAGEVVGFLGPNGAGKTTTLRILTGFIAPTTGTVMLNKHNVVEEPLLVRKDIGYLPENNPLYDTMHVYEYLEYIARIRDVSNVESEVRRVIKACQLTEKIASVIGELSKGYRQRVGLAGALLGDPAILLLDEPTSGLDPNQAADIRELIRTIGKTKTVLFSTHILTEVQKVCDRALIINRGRLVGQGTVTELIAQAQGQQQLSVVIEGPAVDVQRHLQQLPQVTSVQAAQPGQWMIRVSGTTDIRRSIFELCVQQRWALLELTATHRTLEDVFRELTAQ